MADATLEQRVQKLETELSKLRNQLRARTQPKDWRRAIGAFTDDAGMHEILRDAMRLREADRKKVRRKTTTKRKTRQ